MIHVKTKNVSNVLLHYNYKNQLHNLLSIFLIINNCMPLNYDLLPFMGCVVGAFWPCESIICDSSSLSSYFNSANLELEFLTMVATWLSDFRSVATLLSFSAPSFIFSSFLISFRTISFNSSSLYGKRESERSSVERPYLWDNSYNTG